MPKSLDDADTNPEIWHLWTISSWLIHISSWLMCITCQCQSHCMMRVSPLNALKPGCFVQGTAERAEGAYKSSSSSPRTRHQEKGIFICVYISTWLMCIHLFVTHVYSSVRDSYKCLHTLQLHICTASCMYIVTWLVYRKVINMSSWLIVRDSCKCLHTLQLYICTSSCIYISTWLVYRKVINMSSWLD